VRDGLGEVVDNLAEVEASQYELHAKPEHTVTMSRPSGNSYGLVLKQAEDAPFGVLVASVAANGVAELCGIRPGDELLSVDNVAVRKDLSVAVRELQSRAEATVVVRQHTRLGAVAVSQADKDELDSLIETYVCPAPPVRNLIEDDLRLSALMVGKPSDMGLEYAATSPVKATFGLVGFNGAERLAAPPPPAGHRTVGNGGGGGAYFNQGHNKAGAAGRAGGGLEGAGSTRHGYEHVDDHVPFFGSSALPLPEGVGVPAPPAVPPRGGAHGDRGAAAALVRGTSVADMARRCDELKDLLKEIGLPTDDGHAPKRKVRSQLQFMLDELLATEQAYFRDLEVMASRFIFPLLSVEFLSPSEKALLAETPPRLLDFQHSFTKAMNQVIRSPPAAYVEEHLQLLKRQSAARSSSQRTSRRRSDDAGEGAGGGAGGAFAGDVYDGENAPGSLIEESVYNTLEIVRQWAQPPPQVLYPSNDDGSGSDGNAAVPPPPQAPTVMKLREQQRMSRAELVRSVYTELDFEPDGAGSPNFVPDGGDGGGDDGGDGGMGGADGTSSGNLANATKIATLRALGELFVRYSKEFVVYAEYSAWHFAGVKVLLNTENEELQQFLGNAAAFGTTVLGLNSYLIKPIQRVLKYPLLLKGISKEIGKTPALARAQPPVTEALTRMSALATMINEVVGGTI
jgi:hypothetical protein